MTRQLNQLKTKYRDIEQEKIKTNATLSQLARLEDSKTFDQNKKIVGSAPMKTSTGGQNQPASGFNMFHLILVALISLLVGAFISRSANGGAAAEL